MTTDDSAEHGDAIPAYEPSDPEATANRVVREPPMPPPNLNANACSRGTPWTPGNRSSRVNQIIQRMEEEGRALMTEEEVQALAAEFEAAPFAETAEHEALSYEALFEEGQEEEAETGAATAATETATGSTTASTTSATPQPKPRGNGYRKRLPHLLLEGLVLHVSSMVQALILVLDKPHTCKCNTLKGASATPDTGDRVCRNQAADSQQWPALLTTNDHCSFVAGSLLATLHSIRLLASMRPRAEMENGCYNQACLPADGHCAELMGMCALGRYNTNPLEMARAGSLHVYFWASSLMQTVQCIIRTAISLILGRRRHPWAKVQAYIAAVICFFSTNLRLSSGTRSTSAGWAGPKSGRTCRHRSSSRMLFAIVLLLCVISCNAARTDVRVGGLAAVPPEASSEAKPSGAREASMPNSEQSGPTRIVKRTYSRACARAVRQGGSYYQGRWRDLAWYKKTQVRPIYAPRTRTVPAAEGHHIRVCTWNAGGLTRPTFQEIEAWIRDRAIDVMFIQETKWAEEYCWSNREYSYVHSAGANKVDKVGGVLTIVSTRLAKSSDIQFQHIWAGRLLHVRVPTGGSHLDLLCIPILG